jgi:DNA (cytosine-5)-methyltransferase 1
MRPDSGIPFYEFFAGGGLARLGLAPHFACVFANDFDAAKARAYRTAFGDDHLREGDIGALGASDLPGQAGLAWASFPCQDLSLAGGRRGMNGTRSGAFWVFCNLVRSLAEEDRAPPVLALENVTGLLSSRAGADFTALIVALTDLGYRCGALEVDASHFSPQSRPRLFIIAARNARPDLAAPAAESAFHSPGIRAAYGRLPKAARESWVWWRLPPPPLRNTRLEDVLEDEAPDAAWRTPEQTEALLGQMSPLQRARIEAIQKSGKSAVGAVFRRIRIEQGQRVQRAEARFDGLAGCLRTPAGGSSRQMLVFVTPTHVRSRLLAPREAARLMGAPDDYPLPTTQTAALHLLGDAVSVSAVRWLATHLLAPLAGAPLAARRTGS